MSSDITIVPAARIIRPALPDSEKLILHPLGVLLRSVEQHLTYSMRKQIEDEFQTYLGQAQYPVLVGNQVIDRVCALGLPSQPTEQARQILGRSYVERYKETILGRLLLVAMPHMKLEWILRGCPRNYSTATNFGTYWVAEIAPQHWRLDFEDDPGYPDWILGTLQAGGALLRVPDIHITYTMLEAQHTKFDITWRES